MSEPAAMRHAPSSRAARRARPFLRDEGGAMMVFSLFLFVLMLVLGGMAVDLMRFETTRSRLQEVCDRAVLAAADLRQTTPASEVVADYFRAAGLGGEVSDVSVDQTFNSRTVTAEAEAGIDTHFMRLVGVDELDAPARCTANDARLNVEIVLVLDVSGSMDNNSRLTRLRSAARDFVQIVRENDTENRVSIAIVPFNGQVNLGATLFAQYNVTDQHGMATNWHCIDLPPSVFSSPGLSTTLPMPQAGYFDAVQGSGTSVSTTAPTTTTYVAPQSMSPVGLPCLPTLANVVRSPAQDVGALQRQIDDLVAGGSTSITLGMKWGLALLDPGSRAMFTNLIDANPSRMPATLRGRPYDYRQDNTLKVIVLMTDGKHEGSPILDAVSGQRTVPSNIWRVGTGNSATYSAYFDQPGNLDYWVPSVDGDPDLAGRNGAWLAAPHNDTDTDGAGSDTDTDGPGPAVRLGWHQVWSSVRMSWVAWHLYTRASCPLPTSTNPTAGQSCRAATYEPTLDGFASRTRVTDMDSTLQQSCRLARANGVVVYGIAFEAPQEGQAQLQLCTKPDPLGILQPAFYFNAQGLEIRTAFRTIAQQIAALRLTQ